MKSSFGTVALACALLAGCASEVIRFPSSLSATTSSKPARFTLGQPLDLLVGAGERREFRAGTAFVLVGRIKEGEVWKAQDSVLTVTGAHAHEAYLVRQGDKVVGFYLPVEGAFSPSPQPVPMIGEQKEEK